ncbi:MAG: MmgE/PrpD family protein [Chloroflexota bacterium]|nr:MmgE/PrpD family protein [Chloroflexota bacterium]
MGTEKVSQYITNTTYDKIPPDALASAKQAILDCLGVTLAGCDDPGSKIVTEFAKEQGGIAEAGVIGGGFKVPAVEAAWVNGTIAHALDYDDYSTAFMAHPTVALLPAALAVSEKSHLSGKDVLLAYIVGFEVGAAVAPICVMQSYLLGWHSTSVMGTIGAVASCAKLLNLSVEQTSMALGIASSMANGMKENFGTMTKPLHAGNAARNGVLAAQLSQKGFTASENILEGQQGFCRIFAGGAEIDGAKIGESIGQQYTIIGGLSMKPYPSCAGTHATIDSAVYLHGQREIRAEDIEEIEMRTSPGVATACIHSNPQTGLEGKFSNQYCVARGLLDGEVGLRHFTDDMVKDPVIQSLVQKAKYAHTPEMGASFGSEVVVKFRDGSTVSYKVDSPKGFITNPVTIDDTIVKYKDCASLALSSDDAQRSLDLIMNLEDLADIGTLMDILAKKAK